MKKSFAYKLCCAVSVFFIYTAAHAYAAPYLLPLGDSITEGYPEQYAGSYRGYLQEILGKGTYDFVGPFQHGSGDMDPDHAGVSGEETSAILQRLRTYMSSIMADAPAGSVILIHAGTNNMTRGGSADEAFNDIKQMVDVVMQSSNSDNIDIYLATIIPLANNPSENLRALNAKIRDYVARAGIKRLHLADHYGAFLAHDRWETTLMHDMAHPNAAGLKVMAQTWARAMRAESTTTTSTQRANTHTGNHVQNQQTGHRNNPQMTLPQDCAAPFDARSVRNTLLVPARGMRVRCGDNGIIFTVGTAQTYTYKTAYVTTDGNVFTQTVILMGEKTDPSGQWIIGPARGVVPQSAQNQPNYIAVYACQKSDGTFRCGCTSDGRCSRPADGIFQWFVQKFVPTQ